MTKQQHTSAVLTTIAIFLGLVVIFVVLLGIALTTFANDAARQLILVSVGSSILGGALAFFLIRITTLQDTRARLNAEPR